MTYLSIARAAVAALALSAVPAMAGEGNGPSYPGYVVPDATITTSTLTTGTLGNAAGAYTGQPQVSFVFPGTLPSNSNSAGEPEPANSLPRGFEDGIPGQLREQALQHYWATHQ